MLELVWLIPLLPACAAAVLALAGRRWLGEGISSGLAIAAMLAGAVLAFGCFGAVRAIPPESLPHVATLYEWFAVGSLRVAMAFQVDQLTCVMLLFISVVGSLVFVYSVGYMRGDPDYIRFFSLLSLFAASMYLLVLADNFVVMFIGWEGVGLCSYLLIGYYMDKEWAADAGKKAFIVNRIGDFGFLLGMFLIFWQCGSLDFSEVFRKVAQGGVFEPRGVLITVATLLLFLGAVGKSAQIPLFVWLPDAMAGPTPVSALIHAATMVTAGVYMVARLSPLFALAPATLAVIAAVGAATAFVAASIGLTQRDLKKILAYSTVSQLGYMFLALGAGAYASGIFHVFTHAFFKGCLFLCAGSVIHSLGGEQDVFNMGGLRKKMKITWATYLVACLAISGVPPFAGFFSKDEILWRVWEAGGAFRFLWLVGMAAALMTSFYMFRSLFLAFHGESRGDAHAFAHAHESPAWMTIPLLVLAAGSIFAGFVNIPEVLGGAANMERFLAPALAHSVAHASAGAEDSHGTEILLMAISALVGVGGALLAWAVYRGDWKARAAKLARAAGPVYALSANRWWWDDAYNAVIVAGTKMAAAFALLFDERVVDGVANGAGSVTRRFSERLRQLQSGQVQAYALAILVGLNLILLCFLAARG